MADDIVGTWRLETFFMEDVETGRRSEPFGPGPRGTLILHPDGRMAAMIAPRERAAAPQSFVAYSGRYRLEPPGRLVTAVDVSWIEDWIGTEQVRTYLLDGDRLALSTPPGRMPREDGGEVTVKGVMAWTREEPAQG
jgi:hypothetical protein